jgi:hypothetical protein
MPARTEEKTDISGAIRSIQNVVKREWLQVLPICYDGAMETLELKWLGPPRVKVDGRPVRLETRKVSALLAVLSLGRRPQSREYLAALLWPEFDSRRAPANLRRALTSLQGSLGAGWVQADREAIALSGMGEVWVDIEEVFMRVREVRAHHPKPGERLCGSCAAKLGEAAGLHRGDFLEGFNLKDCPASTSGRWRSAKSCLRRWAGHWSVLPKPTARPAAGRRQSGWRGAGWRWTRCTSPRTAP